MKKYVDDTLSLNSVIQQCSPGDIIILKPGIYNEKIEIITNNITIMGENAETTIISNHDFYHKIMNDNNECNTFRTYTCYVEGNNVTFENVTIQNTSLPSSKYGQAVALHVSGNDFKCNNCIIKSAQDTLFTGPLPKNLLDRYKNFLPEGQLKGTLSKQIYKNCTIFGDVDFIFGGGTALFLECNIISIDHKDKRKPDGYICAPSHYEELPYGYLFHKCNLIKENDNVKDVYLARPWRDYGCAAFIECKMDNHINPLGFNKWANTNRDKTARFYEDYTTFNDNREKWVNSLSKNEAEQYVKNFYKYINFKEN